MYEVKVARWEEECRKGKEGEGRREQGRMNIQNCMDGQAEE